MIAVFVPSTLFVVSTISAIGTAYIEAWSGGYSWYQGRWWKRILSFFWLVFGFATFVAALNLMLYPSLGGW